MAGQVWSVNTEGGFLYSDNLSEMLRLVAQPMCKFRQLCDAKDGSELGLGNGDTFRWNVVSNVGTQGRRLSETTAIPETGFALTQKEIKIFECGNSIPYTAKLDALIGQDAISIVNDVLKVDAEKFFDIEAWQEFNRCKLRVAPTGGTSTTAVTLTTNGATTETNNVELRTGHTKAIVDLMKERNIPVYPETGGDYVAVAHTSTYRTYKNDLETLKQYTETGLGHIFDGEIGRYEGTRHIEQNFIPKGGANDSTTFDPFAQVADPWNNAKSSWAMFMGGDTVTEALVIPEEIRAKLPGDYGRSKGLAWYGMTGFGLVHDDAPQGRVVKWDSAA